MLSKTTSTFPHRSDNTQCSYTFTQFPVLESPQCSKHANYLPCEDSHNVNAWMIGEIFRVNVITGMLWAENLKILPLCDDFLGYTTCAKTLLIFLSCHLTIFQFCSLSLQNNPCCRSTLQVTASTASVGHHFISS